MPEGSHSIHHAPMRQATAAAAYRLLLLGLRLARVAGNEMKRTGADEAVALGCFLCAAAEADQLRHAR